MIQKTSLMAYREEIEPSIGSRQQKILDVIAKHSDITNTEISRETGLPINSVTPRTFELREKKLVIESCKRKCNVTGRMAIAWRITKNTLF